MREKSSILTQGALFTILGVNFLSIFLIHFLGPQQIFLALKDLLLLLLIGSHAFLVRKTDWKRVNGLLPILLLLSVYFIVGTEPFMAKVGSLRQLVIPYGIISLGYLLTYSFDEQRLEKWLKNSIYFLTMGSLIIYLGLIFEWLPMEAWGDMKQLALSIFDIPYMFYDGLTGDFIRNVSTFLDPINLGHYLVFVLIYFFYTKKAHPVFLLLVFVSLSFTICKGAFLQLALTIYIIERKRLPQWLFYMGLLSIAPLLYWASLHHDGIALHLHGLQEAITHMSFLGEGLGAVGNQAVLFEGSTSLAIYDTFLGSVLGQLGLLGLLCWLLPFVLLCLKLKKHIWLQALLISQLVIALISENAFNFLSVLPLMLFLGFYLNKENGK